MGVFAVPIQVGDLAGRQFIDVAALVDTGSSFTFLPTGMLDQLGIEPVGLADFELANQRVERYPIGHARMRLAEQERIVPIVFGPENIEPLLGATALEIFLLAADPINHRLIPVRGRLKYLL
jgi:predicted aspartyl protease